MILITQIRTIFLSFIYGMSFKLLFKINKKFLLSKNLIFKIVINVLFVLDNTLVFFIVIGFVNNSKLHFYYIPFFVLGVIFYNYYFTSNKNRNWP